MAWQSDAPDDRLRRIVGNVYREDEGIFLEYAVDSDDYRAAVKNGFKGIPSFPCDRASSYEENVLEYLEKRLPPRNRRDFNVFLQSYGLEPGAKLSNFALVGYTEGRLPADRFSFIHPFEVDGPCEFVMEIAGTRHHCSASFLRESIDSQITFKEEINDQEPTGTAFQIEMNGESIGYVNRVYLSRFRKWSSVGGLKGTLVRVNGTDERPRAFVFVEVI